MAEALSFDLALFLVATALAKMLGFWEEAVVPPAPAAVEVFFFFLLSPGVLGSADFLGLGGALLLTPLLRFCSMARSSLALSETLLET